MTMTPVPKEKDNRTVWKAEVTQDMINHLSEEQRRELMRELSKAVDAIGSEYEVGREFNHE
jgi:uncharacterized tellurite resistance protein B-like protein